MPALEPSGPPFPDAPPPTWPGATWIGSVIVEPDAAATEPAADTGGETPLPHGQGYSRARLLVRGATRLYGMATVDVRDGAVRTDELEQAVDAAIAAAPPDPVSDDVEQAPTPALSVVLCTRDRPEALRVALGSVLAQEYPEFEVIVVDNAPATDATARVVAELDHPRVRLITEPVPGLSVARNTGVAAASAPWVVFTDDDVRTDPGWLRAVARGIASGGRRCACVSGFVPTGELRTPAQAWFDSRIGWNRVFVPRVFRLSEPPADLPLFPFQVGVYGAGANFAARRDVIAALRGFDVHLGAGTDTKGGEDIDFFFRVILAGHTLVYEPSAIVWHRHRDTDDALVSQAVGYGRGFAAWATKTLLSPANLTRGLWAVARRGSLNLKPLADYRDPMSADTPPPPVGVDVLRVEHRATLSGPPAYLRSRLRPAVRRARSLVDSARRAADERMCALRRR